MAMKINDKIYRRKTNKLERFVKRRLPKQTLKEFKENTPIDKGFARRNTKLNKTKDGFKVTGDYDYSGVIDKGLYPKNPVKGTGKTNGGFSTQAPKGIVEPTLRTMEEQIRRFIRSIR